MKLQEISRDRLDIREKLASGAFSIVHKGKLKDYNSQTTNTGYLRGKAPITQMISDEMNTNDYVDCSVAVKTPPENSDIQAHLDFIKEIEFMMVRNYLKDII